MMHLQNIRGLARHMRFQNLHIHTCTRDGVFLWVFWVLGRVVWVFGLLWFLGFLGFFGFRFLGLGLFWLRFFGLIWFFWVFWFWLFGLFRLVRLLWWLGWSRWRWNIVNIAAGEVWSYWPNLRISVNVSPSPCITFAVKDLPEDWKFHTTHGAPLAFGVITEFGRSAHPCWPVQCFAVRLYVIFLQVAVLCFWCLVSPYGHWDGNSRGNSSCRWEDCTAGCEKAEAE